MFFTWFMGMAKFTDDHSEISNSFEQLRGLQQQHLTHHPELTELSMGMSNDYTLALGKEAPCYELEAQYLEVEPRIITGSHSTFSFFFRIVLSTINI